MDAMDGMEAVEYRVDARVFIPLGFVSVPIVSRTGVGVARFAMRDVDGPQDIDQTTRRAYEFYAASLPERARGLNRLGLIREIRESEGARINWTVQFGVISTDRAQSREAAERTLAGSGTSEEQAFDVVDAFVGLHASASEVVELRLGGSWPRPEALYDDVVPRWASSDQRRARTIVNTATRYSEPVGFLGAMELSLHRTARTLAAGATVRAHRTSYVHHSRVYAVELSRHSVDTDRGRAYAERGLMAADALLHRLQYRVVNEVGAEVESFDLWMAQTGGQSAQPSVSSLVPVAFRLRPRAYLELTAEQVPASASE